jgi:hypothetical protein
MDFTDLLNARAYDLGQPYFPGMPHFPSHPPFLYSLTKKHGDILYSGGATSAADAIALGTHVGTHIDALSHFSCNGVFYGGDQVEHTYEHGMMELGVETVAPIVRRGVLLDIAGFEGVDVLPASFEVTPNHLSRASSTEINSTFAVQRVGSRKPFIFSEGNAKVSTTFGVEEEDLTGQQK